MNTNQPDGEFSNPPYNDNLNLDFFVESVKSVKETVIYIQPSNFILDEKGIASKFKEAKAVCGKHIKEIRLFNGNAVFGIGLFLPLMMIHIDKTKEYEQIKVVDKINDTVDYYNNINDINKFGNISEYYSLKEKILKESNKNNLWKVYKENVVEKSYVVSFTGIRGNVNMNNNDPSAMINTDFYTIVSSEKDVKSLSEKDNKKDWLHYYFDTKEEAQNFLDYLKTKVARFSLAIYKLNQNLHRGELSSVPYLDFTRKWDDKQLKEFLNITDREFNFIDKNIPDYYKEKENV